MKRIFLIASAAAMLVGTSCAASAQVWDNPPGWAWQRRGILDDQGVNPERFGYWGGYGAYGAYPYGGYDSYAYVPPRGYYRSWRRDNPPGSRFQNRGIDEDNNRPLRRRH
jgi:hypothetical protein